MCFGSNQWKYVVFVLMMDESDVWDVTQIHFCCYVNCRAYVLFEVENFDSGVDLFLRARCHTGVECELGLFRPKFVESLGN